MNSTLALDMNTSLGEQLAFLAVPAKRSSEQVSTTVEQIFTGITKLIDSLILDVIRTRTREEFCEKVDVAFPHFAKIMIALSKLITASIDQRVVERLTYESLSELESDFRNEGQIFGEVIRDQAIFAAWTLRKIHELVQQCSVAGISSEAARTDQEFATKYLSNVLYVRFCLSCLRASLETGIALFPEPLDEISDGLRAVVNAYAWVRQGRDLRHPVSEEEFVEIPWDEEQEELLRSSVEEMLREEY